MILKFNVSIFFLFSQTHLVSSIGGILYIYFPCIREIWRFVHPSEIWLFRGWTNFHISIMQGKWMFYSTRSTFWWILLNEIFWPSLFTKLLFLNISGVIFTNMEYRYMTKALNLLSWEFRIREIRYCWEGNTILLRGKYDVVEREIRCFDKCHVGLFQPIEFLYK